MLFVAAGVGVGADDGWEGVLVVMVGRGALYATDGHTCECARRCDEEGSEGEGQTAKGWVSLGCGVDAECAQSETDGTAEDTSSDGGSVIASARGRVEGVVCVLVVFRLFFLGQDLHLGWCVEVKCVLRVVKTDERAFDKIYKRVATSYCTSIASCCSNVPFQPNPSTGQCPSERHLRRAEVIPHLSRPPLPGPAAAGPSSVVDPSYPRLPGLLADCRWTCDLLTETVRIFCHAILFVPISLAVRVDSVS